MDEELFGPMRRLVREALDGDDVADDDNFFELGGNSFMAVELVDRVHHEFGVKMDLGDFFADPTVSGLVAALAEARHG
ncbi:acyl carrier protein [Nonomuraea sp. NN258]|uniref:acyl carrier protein n=1 Tax=Nonomuraea antri TaxID=2730852 RepID=UPI00156883DF|nr:acyl carrier protein [Nonomuraea antri]NRQ33081.1 acyl carrier protein [Nonomuraea antri]